MVKRYAIGDVLEIKHGFAFSGEHIVTSDNGVVLVTPGNFRIGGGFQENKCKFYSGDYPAEYVLPAGTHIVTMTDLSKEIDTLGYSAIVPASERTYLHNQRIGRIVYKNNCIYPLYMHYLMRTRDYQRFVANSSSGATVHHTSPDKICKYEFTAPSRARQEEIADFLHAYDALIENNRRQIKLLEEAAQRLYKEWFVDLRFPGNEQTPITNGVPQGWRPVLVRDACSVLKRGISPMYDERANLTVLNQKCIRTSIVSLEEARQQRKAYPAELNVQDADTLICSTGTGTLGRVGCVHGELHNTTIDSHVTLVRADEGVTNKHYLYHFLKSQQPYLMQSGKGSTNQQELYKDVIGQLKMLLPGAGLLQSFENLAADFHHEITLLNTSLKLLAEARDRLLPKLMSGEIEEQALS